MTTPGLRLLHPHIRDIGGIAVQRLLPAAGMRTVGPFIFLDHIGPADLPPGGGVDVGPHPHIGLATVTYLFAGALLHRDSLGSVQEISPGDVNWMTAGRGIVHSERTPAAARSGGARIHGLQTWVALPADHEQDAPSFQHFPCAALPRLEGRQETLTLIAGSAFGLASPVRTASPLFYADLELRTDASFLLTTEHTERAVFPVTGQLQIDGTDIPPGQLAVLAPGQAATLSSRGDCRAMLLGGSPLDGPRHIWWNFVASTPALIERAKQDWLADTMGSIPGESTRLPLPPR